MAQAASQALIVVGLTGSETDRDNFVSIADQVRKGLVQRGFKPETITTLGTDAKNKISREAILKAIQSTAGSLQTADDFWLILLGHSGRASDNQPAFQVKGTRLTAGDLQGALRGLKARQTIFIGTENGAAYIPLLKNDRSLILAATDAEGEINQPRFPEKWAAALSENPTWTPVQVAARASQLVEKEYESNMLAQGENAKLYDPISDKILSAPFGVKDLSSGLAARPGAPGLTPVDPADIDIPKDKQRYHREAATAETKAIIAEAHKAANPEGHSALVMQESVDYTVNPSFVTVEQHLLRVYIANEEAVEEWSRYSFPNDPGLVTSKIPSARVILPDASAFVMNVDKVSGTVDSGPTCSSCPVRLLLPEVHAGCVVEVAWRIEGQSPGSLPFFYEEIPVQRHVPVLHADYTVKVPKKGKFKYRLKNLESAPVVSETENSQVVKWAFPNGLPAFESLPYDPPARDMVALLQIGSMESWNDFVAWFRRIAKDSDKSGPEVAVLAKEISRDHPKRADKIKAAFEYVSGLRYVAIEIGVHAFRPRTPAEVLNNRYGDCKDKANLLAALLREMGIPSSIALINRMSSTDEDFPGWQFNHAITYVAPAPDQGQKEGVWLDTTDTTTPYGFVAPGNLGRTALVLPPNQVNGQFLAVTDPNRSVTQQQEWWEWVQGDNGQWTGTLKKEWGGLAEYSQRLELKGRTPAQRQFLLQEDLTEEALGVDFTTVAVSDVTDLSVPLHLTANVTGRDLACRVLGSKLLTQMAPPVRNRALVLNDGQPLEAMRKVRLVFAKPVPAPARKELKSVVWDGCGLQLDYQQRWLDERTCERVEKIALTKPVIASRDYASVRVGLQQWLRQVRAAQEALPE
jgi:transglutaminase-like putative cysteine protease